MSLLATLPLELESLVLDYKNQLEMVEKMRTICDEIKEKVSWDYTTCSYEPPSSRCNWGKNETSYQDYNYLQVFDSIGEYFQGSLSVFHKEGYMTQITTTTVGLVTIEDC